MCVCVSACVSVVCYTHLVYTYTSQVDNTQFDQSKLMFGRTYNLKFDGLSIQFYCSNFLLVNNGVNVCE